MYCYQCEQTAKGTGCTTFGVCGKDAATAALQDLLVYATKGISMYAHRAAQLGAGDREVDRAVIECLFATVTNVDFDPEAARRHTSIDAAAIRDKAKTLYEAACAKAGKTPEKLGGPGRLAAGRRSRRPGATGRRGVDHQAASAASAPTWPACRN